MSCRVYIGMVPIVSLPGMLAFLLNAVLVVSCITQHKAKCGILTVDACKDGVLLFLMGLVYIDAQIQITGLTKTLTVGTVFN